jgi:hypothetical protein
VIRPTPNHISFVLSKNTLHVSQVLVEGHGCDKEEVMAKLPDLQARMEEHFAANKSRRVVNNNNYAPVA